MDKKPIPLCANCQTAIESRSLGYGVVYICKNCGGTAIGISALKRRNADIKFVNDIWRETREHPILGNKACPFCLKLMNSVRRSIEGKAFEVDVCAKCMTVWLDAGESDFFPKTVEGKDLSYAGDDGLSPEAREALAIFKVRERIRQDIDDDFKSESPDSASKVILTILGFPVKSGGSTLNVVPYAVWSIATIIVLAFILSYSNINDIAQRWGMLPSEWHRNYGLTFVTSFFLHADFFHLVYNLYFFMLFGSHAEQNLGKWRFILLVLFSHLVGIFCHFLLSPDATISVIGASAGISGVLAYYAIMYPKDKITIFYLFYFQYGWLRLSVIYAFAIHLIFQITGLVSQLLGMSPISYIAHLGGILVGVWTAFWIKSSIKEG